MLFKKLIIIPIAIISLDGLTGINNINQTPFENNLRIMSFSNLNGAINESEYYQGGNSISHGGTEQYPIVSNKGIEKHFFLKRDKFHGGGMINLAKLIETKRLEVGYKNNVLVDAGGTLVTNDIDSDNFKNTMSLHIDMGVDVFGIGRELLNGEEQIMHIAKEYEGSEVGIVSTNISDDGGFLFNPFMEFAFAGKKIVFVGHSNVHIGQGKIYKSGFYVSKKLDNLRKMVGYFVDDDLFVILVSSNSIAHNSEIARTIPGIRVIIGGSDSLELPHPIFVKNDLGNTLITTSGSNGMFLSTLDINLDSKNMDEFRYKLIPTISKDIKKKLQGYRFFFGQEKFDFKKIIKTNKALSVDSIKMGSLDSFFLKSLADHLKPDLIIGSPPLGKISIKENNDITEEHLLTYFGMGNNKIIDSFFTGEKIKEIIYKYYNSNYYLSNGNYMNIRHFGLDFTVTQKNNENIIKINSINNKPFDEKTQYRLVGWGDWISKATDGIGIEKFIMEEIFK